MTTLPPVTELLSRFAATMRFEDIPTKVIERSQLLFMDLSGIMIRSQSLDSTLVMKEALHDLGLDKGTIRVLGSAQGWTPQAAALLAGAAAHSLDFDDTHAQSALHPGAAVIPAALAAAQMTNATTRELLTGIVAGYEVMIRVALGVGPMPHSERGYHLSATTGVFGSAAAAGNILKLTPKQMEHAFGTALSESAGTGQFAVNGAWTKRFHVGNAAAGGLLASVLARRGYTGATQALEGREGFFNVYSPAPRPEAAVQGLGTVWETLQSGLKPYPCCRGIHAPLDAVMLLHAKYKIDIEKIVSVNVGMAKRSVYVVGEPQDRRRNPQNVVDCQFSTHLCLAVALKTGHMGWDDYEPALADPAIRALMQRIQVSEDAECEAGFPEVFSGVVEIRTTDGQTWREFVRVPRGEPITMLSSQELRSKFSLLVRGALGADGESALFGAIQRMGEDRALTDLFQHAEPRTVQSVH